MKKLILMFLVAFAAPAMAQNADDAAKKQACVEALNADPLFAKAVLTTYDKTLEQKTIDAHTDAYNHIQKNEKHVVYAYAAMWVIAALFVIFLFLRQQKLKAEIAALRRDLEATAKETA